MAKNKKTRKEKKLADQRKSVTVTSEKQLTPVKEQVATALTPTTAEQNRSTRVNAPTAAISTGGYNYLFKDLAKTAILTSSIIIAEIAIKYVARI